jgi:hypothetical protein
MKSVNTTYELLYHEGMSQRQIRNGDYLVRCRAKRYKDGISHVRHNVGIPAVCVKC